MNSTSATAATPSRRRKRRRNLGITMSMLVIAALSSLQVGTPASAAPVQGAAPSPDTATAAAAWKSWNFDIWAPQQSGHAQGRVAYKPMGIKKRYGTCYYTQLPRWNQSWVDDTKPDGQGVHVYLVYTDCRDGHTATVSAGYVAGVDTPRKALETPVYKYATKAGVSICVQYVGCNEKR